MYRFLGFISLLSFPLAAIFSQTASVELSPEFKLPKNKAYQGHLFSDQSSHFVYFNDYGKRDEATVVLEKFDSKFKLGFSKEFKSSKDHTASLGIKYLKGNFAWLISERNNKEDFLKYYLAPISMDGKLGKLSQVANFTYEKKRDAPKVNWSLSADTSQILFTAVADNDDKDNKLDMFISVVDKDFKTVWDKKVKLSKTEEQVEVVTWALAANGDAFMLAKIYDGKKAKETKRGKDGKVAGYQMKLYHFSKDKPDPTQYDFKLGDSFIKGAHLGIDKKGDLFSVGFFSNTRSGSTTGVFYMRVSSTDGSVLAVNKHDFSKEDLDILGDGNTSKDKEGEEGIDANFKFKDLLFRSDGSALVTAEENYLVVNHSTNSRGLTITTTTYYSKDIIAINIDPEGKITKTSLIPKRQRFSTDKFEYFTTLVNKDDVYFFYNEDEDNLKKPIGSKPKYISSFKDCTAVMTKLDATGKLTRKQILDNDDAKELFVPSNSRQFNDNQLFFTCMKFKFLAADNFRMGIVTLK